MQKPIDQSFNMEKNSEALKLLQDWQAKDPGARVMKIEYYNSGWFVQLYSSRIKRLNCKSLHWYFGNTLISAVTKALKAYHKAVKAK